MIEIEVIIKVKNNDVCESVGSHKSRYESEDSSLDNLAQSIAYAIPKHDFPNFSILQLFDEGKLVGHGEI